MFSKMYLQLVEAFKLEAINYDLYNFTYKINKNQFAAI